VCTQAPKGTEGGVISFPGIRSRERCGALKSERTLPAVTPSLVGNISTNTTWSRFAGDMIIDSGGFGASELAGTALGAALSQYGPGFAIAGKVVGDFGVGVTWDLTKGSSSSRENFALQIDQVSENMIQTMNSIAIGTPNNNSLYPAPQPVPHPNSLIISTPCP